MIYWGLVKICSLILANCLNSLARMVMGKKPKLNFAFKTLF